MAYPGLPLTDAKDTWTLHPPSANTAAVVTLPAGGAGTRNVVDQIFFSYSASPTNGSLVITDGGATVISVAITATGLQSMVFVRPYVAAENSAVVVTLAAGGGSVVGKLNVQSR